MTGMTADVLLFEADSHIRTLGRIIAKPSGGYGFGFREKPHRLFAINMQIAIKRILPAGKRKKRHIVLTIL